jgi:5-epi-alpha-selinene synthase
MNNASQTSSDRDTGNSPELYSPFRWQMNQNVMAASSHASAWAARFCLFPDEQMRVRFTAMEVPQLSAMAYPTCSSAALEIATDWCVWLFAWDDKCDRTPLGRSPEELTQAHSAFLRILRGSPPEPGASPLAPALADLRDRMLAMNDSPWFARFAARVQDYFSGCVWEAQNRVEQSIPTLESYVSMRPASGAVYTAFELFALGGDAELSGPVRDDEEQLVTLELLANNIICYANDILSLHRELKSGDFHNLVIVLMHHECLPLNDALSSAVQIHDAEVRRYQEIEQRLHSHETRVSSATSRHCSRLRAWIAANQRWSLSTRRYRTTDSSLET